MLRHPDVQRSGCTRTGVPLYACVSEDLSKTVTEELVVEALEQASIKEGACCVSKRCWKQRRAWTGEHEWKKLQRKTEIRQKEIERLEAATKEIPELWEERAATRQKNEELAGKFLLVLECRDTQTDRKRVVAEGQKKTKRFVFGRNVA